LTDLNVVGAGFNVVGNAGWRGHRQAVGLEAVDVEADTLGGTLGLEFLANKEGHYSCISIRIILLPTHPPRDAFRSVQKAGWGRRATPLACTGIIRSGQKSLARRYRMFT
jgi:hypothetical protein